MCSAFISCIHMYNVHLLIEIIKMNFSTSTPFDRQSTVNKQTEYWYVRTWDGN